MINGKHKHISVRRQCLLLGVSRSRVYYEAAPETEENLRYMLEIDKLHLNNPSYGSRKIADILSLQFDVPVDRKRIRRLMRKMGIEAIYRCRKTSIPAPGNHIYPYLLEGLDIDRPNQVWCADITYLPMRGSFMYLVAVMDWYSRKILGWALSNTQDTAFCLKALEMALETAGCKPEIFNTDQGCQFTSEDWIKRLKDLQEVSISMDSKGRWVDNVVIERFWRSLKYDDVYLKYYESIPELEQGVGEYINQYNSYRPHAALGRRTRPDDVYYNKKAA